MRKLCHWEDFGWEDEDSISFWLDIWFLQIILNKYKVKNQISVYTNYQIEWRNNTIKSNKSKYIRFDSIFDFFYCNMQLVCCPSPNLKWWVDIVTWNTFLWTFSQHALSQDCYFLFIINFIFVYNCFILFIIIIIFIYKNCQFFFVN